MPAPARFAPIARLDEIRFSYQSLPKNKTSK
jgi:hypothetical protein